MTTRVRAMDALRAVLAGEKADAAIERAREGLAAADGHWVHAAVMGVLRHYFSLEADLMRFLRRRPAMRAWCALLVGAFQIRHMRVPAHAAVGETVAAVKRGSPRAAGLVNAVLRRLLAAPPPAPDGHRARELPAWLDARLRDALGEEALARMCAVIRTPPPLTLAVLGDRDAWLAAARAAGFKARAGGLSPHAVLLEAAAPVERLPGYARGAFVVMDQAAQAAVLALDETMAGRAPRRMLDLCAAPGGKTALLAARHPGARLLAVERNPRRLPRLRENLRRVAAQALPLRADAGRLPLPDACADAILLDAPCSATGVLRRHPDVKLLRRARDLPALAAIQRRLLDEAWRVLAPGGALVYAVCSVLPEEGARLVAGRDGLLESRLLPPTEDHDGFFIARFRKPCDA